MSELLLVENLEVAYGTIQALKGISFSVPAGQIVTIVGANGAGKSTTLLTISGLVRARGGSITFDGQAITHKRADQISRARLLQVPEGRQVIANMSVAENLEMGAYVRGNNRDVKRDMAEIFERFPRLGERQNQMAGSLSGGEQQMLAIGRALMGKPKLLMLDEPSMGLAPILVNAVFEIIQTINQEGTTVLLVEQNARKALQIADYAYILERGEVSLHGPAADLKDNPDVISAYLG